jgi:hypothetical protein
MIDGKVTFGITTKLVDPKIQFQRFRLARTIFS